MAWWDDLDHDPTSVDDPYYVHANVDLDPVGVATEGDE